MKYLKEYGNEQILVIEKNVKNMTFKIDNDNQFVLVVPYGVKNKQIDFFVEKVITKMIDYRNKKLLHSKYNFKNKPYIWINNKKYEILVNLNKDLKRSKIELEDRFLKVTTFDLNQVEKTVWKFLSKQAKIVWEPFLDKYAKKMGVIYSELKILKLKTRWGTCNYVSGVVTLNVKLISYSLEAQIYVIVHELAHLIYPNHSKQFWNEVEKHFRDYKKYRKELKY